MKERDRITLFLKFAKARLNETFLGEAKIVKGPSIPFSDLQPHQEAALYQANHGIMNHKISDSGLGVKPCDLFQMYRVPAYVVLFWYEHPGDRRLAMVPIDAWCHERETSERKSLVYSRACEIGKCFEL